MNKCIMIKDIKNALIELARSNKWLGRETTTNIIEALLSLPTIDIVRCKDCKWYRDFDGCFFSSSECEPEHFCSWGERKEK